MNYHNYTNNLVDKQYSCLSNNSCNLYNSTWRPDTVENNSILHSEKIDSNWKYRRFLQHNTELIIPLNKEIDLEDKNYHAPFKKNIIKETPILYNDCLEKKNNNYIPFSDLQQHYLNSYEEKCRSFCPKLTI